MLLCLLKLPDSMEEKPKSLLPATLLDLDFFDSYFNRSEKQKAPRPAWSEPWAARAAPCSFPCPPTVLTVRGPSRQHEDVRGRGKVHGDRGGTALIKPCWLSPWDGLGGHCQGSLPQICWAGGAEPRGGQLSTKRSRGTAPCCSVLAGRAATTALTTSCTSLPRQQPGPPSRTSVLQNTERCFPRCSSPLSRASRKSRFLCSSFMNSSFCRKSAIRSSSRYCFHLLSCSSEPWPRGTSPLGTGCRQPGEPWAGGRQGRGWARPWDLAPHKAPQSPPLYADPGILLLRAVGSGVPASLSNSPTRRGTPQPGQRGHWAPPQGGGARGWHSCTGAHTPCGLGTSTAQQGAAVPLEELIFRAYWQVFLI